jgi:hypothetical protein
MSETADARRRRPCPARMGTTVHGLAFVSNRVLHSGLDGERGQFIAAYGMETAGRGGVS